MSQPVKPQARQVKGLDAPLRAMRFIGKGAMQGAAICVLALLVGSEPSAAQENADDDSLVIEEQPVTLAGKIENYKQVYNSGKLTCFDAVTRIPQEHVFEIDQDGNFSVEFDLLHSVLGCANLDLEGEFYPMFLESGKAYQVSIDAGEILFQGEAGGLSNEISDYSATLARDLASERSAVSSLHGEAPTVAEAVDAYEQFAEQRLAHLTEYAEAHSMSAAARRIIELDIEYEAAHSLVCFRYDSTGGRVKPRASLPADYLDTLFERYPINQSGAQVSRRYIDYLSNIRQVLEQPRDESVEARVACYETHELFTPEELELIAGAYRGDTEVLASEEFASFDTPENQLKEFELRKRYKLKTLMDQVTRFSPGPGRDLILSQGLAKNYFAGDFIRPTSDEWVELESKIQSKGILDHLKRQAQLGQQPSLDPHEGSAAEATSSDESSVAKLLAANHGKVIYIDFWATWCAPCRAEIPDAKRLISEFEKEDVVFLNLCAQSRKEDWSRMVEQKELEGEHLFLNDSEYEQLAKLYDVNGFPTYVLIDRQGKVVSKSAPRPSSRDLIISKIRALLK